MAHAVTSIARTPGRRVQSVAESSFDAWIKYYRQDENAPNAIVSYYSKGSLVALALDPQNLEGPEARGQLGAGDNADAVLRSARCLLSRSALPLQCFGWHEVQYYIRRAVQAALYMGRRLSLT